MSILDEIKTSYLFKNQCLEYKNQWQNRKVKSPFSNRMILVGSLPFDQQQKYRPKELQVQDDADQKAKEFDEKHKNVFDFYISVPKDFETVDDYLEQNHNILASTDSSDVMNLFDKNNYVIKLVSVPVAAVQKYLTAKNTDDIKNAEFKDLDKSDLNKAYDFVRFNDYHIFVITPQKYKEDIRIVNDTPDKKTGFITRTPDEEDVLETVRKEYTKILTEKKNILDVVSEAII